MAFLSIFLGYPSIYTSRWFWLGLAFFKRPCLEATLWVFAKLQTPNALPWIDLFWTTSLLWIAKKDQFISDAALTIHIYTVAQMKGEKPTHLIGKKWTMKMYRVSRYRGHLYTAVFIDVMNDHFAQPWDTDWPVRIEDWTLETSIVEQNYPSWVNRHMLIQAFKKTIKNSSDYMYFMDCFRHDSIYSTAVSRNKKLFERKVPVRPVLSENNPHCFLLSTLFHSSQHVFQTWGFRSKERALLSGTLFWAEFEWIDLFPVRTK